ncbi:uncharacterized protein LOC143238991 [Tachypleus tridentatus]|uniref:uncharacterized protein LOC143238991 n=1 Tax=Tachypleus tridentatus TaxID=6853 RepID=UPI003FCFB433
MGDDSRVVNGVDLASVDDEAFLYQLIDNTEDIDQRKLVRARLREVQAASRAKREEMMKNREKNVKMPSNNVRGSRREERRTLAMYDGMAKSAPAGGPKTMDINIYKEGKPGLDENLLWHNRSAIWWKNQFVNDKGSR